MHSECMFLKLFFFNFFFGTLYAGLNLFVDSRCYLDLILLKVKHLSEFTVLPEHK